MQIQQAYIVSAIRTPVGKAGGMFEHIRPDTLMAYSIKKALAKVPVIHPENINDVIIGCAMPEAEQGMNVARIATLLAGLPDCVPAMTINRFCSSGLQTIASAANQIALGQADVVIAGGTESMSMVPLGGHNLMTNPDIFLDNENVAIAYGMGITAEKVAEQWQISREAQDNYALQSHQRAITAMDNNEFADEIVSVTVNSATANLLSGKIDVKAQIINKDEGPRRDTSLEKISKLKPVFAANGTVTAATSSQTSDGAAALVLVSEKFLQQHQLQPIARFVGYAVTGLAPEIMGVGPIKAIPKVLKQVGLKQDDIDWIELNEAFAAQTLAIANELALDPEKLNPLGGAIALGHPLGATGAIRATTLVHGLKRRRLRYGMVTMCIGTGMGAAGIFEAM